MTQSGEALPVSVSAGGAIFRRLKQLGVDVVFANPGTDFPPLIEGLAEAHAQDAEVPRVLLVAHESVAMGMAHGYYVSTQRAQSVMLHTNVGLANGVTGAINAASDHAPIILMSGRTPTLERGRFGARTNPIGWGQEMSDQSALVREVCKWDYELRFPEQVAELLDRAHAIASSTPKGPVYLSLPREVLCEPCPVSVLETDTAMNPAVVVASEADIVRIANMLVSARRPVICAQRGAGTSAGFEALARLVEQWSIPVCQYWAVANAISAEHPMFIGEDPEPWISEADVILVIDSLAPWMPDLHQPGDDAQVIQLGPDPLFSQVPVRNFRTSMALRSEVGPALVALESAMADLDDPQQGVRSRRRSAIDEHVVARRQVLEEKAGEVQMSKAYVSRCIGEAVAGRSATVLSELGAAMEFLAPTEHDSWRKAPFSGGLGWSLPCAMGMKLADPDRLVVATMGDGTYMFANPVACHQVAEAYGIAVLTVVFNNAAYGVVGQAALGMYPHGYAANTEDVALTTLSPCPDFVEIAKASRSFAERVDDAVNLPGALERAIHAVTVEGHQALLDVRLDS